MCVCVYKSDAENEQTDEWIDTVGPSGVPFRKVKSIKKTSSTYSLMLFILVWVNVGLSHISVYAIVFKDYCINYWI